MAAYYNEIDPLAAAWLRELMKRNLIAPGEVDERSIEDVCADDIKGFTQCHWFAGIGTWSYALRRAGWPDDSPIWSASCPCQGFSAAGKGGGFNDERHLWPALFHLVYICRPLDLIGEQVASQLGLEWFDLVSSDLEGAGYGNADRPQGPRGRLEDTVPLASWPTPKTTDYKSGLAKLAMGETKHGSHLQNFAQLSGWPTPCGQDGPKGGPGQGADRLPGSVALTGWATPNTVDSKLGTRKGEGQIQLCHQVVQAGWATPAHRDYRGANALPRNQRGGGSKGEQLPNQAVHLTGWATPATSDGNGGKRPHPETTMTGKHPDGRKVNMGLASQVHTGFLEIGPARLTASGQMLTGCDAEMGNGGQLNPAHSRWLMGLPSEWDDCGVTAMESLRRKRKRS